MDWMDFLCTLLLSALLFLLFVFFARAALFWVIGKLVQFGQKWRARRRQQRAGDAAISAASAYLSKPAEIHEGVTTMPTTAFQQAGDDRPGPGSFPQGKQPEITALGNGQLDLDGLLQERVWEVQSDLNQYAKGRHAYFFPLEAIGIYLTMLNAREEMPELQKLASQNQSSASSQGAERREEA